MIRIIITVFIAIYLSSCSGNNAYKNVSKIRSELKKNYSIKDGEIVAKFDLNGIEQNNEKLFSTYYGATINNTNFNKKFLEDFSKKYRYKNIIRKTSFEKLSKLSDALNNLNKKYKILPSHVIYKIKNYSSFFSKNKEILSKDTRDYYSSLVALHNSTKNIPIFVPLDNPKITSKFGTRKHPKHGKITKHNGLDLAGKVTCRIYAAADGIVEEISRSNSYGNNIIIKHSDQIRTRYAHLSKFFVKEGEKVILGQNIGSQGSSGTATGPHLHFEVIINKATVDPLDFIKSSL